MDAIRDAIVNRTQLSRLLQLIMALRAARFPNASDLARLCEVSRRTIYRDLDTLQAAGVPVRYVPERQGYQLAQGFALDPPRLTEREATALLVLAHRWDGEDGLGLWRDAKAGAWKVLEGLSGESRDRALALAELVRFWAEGTPAPPGRAPIYEAALRSLADRRQIRIWYRETGGRGVVVTKLSPYRLVFHRGAWCLIGRSSLDRQVRTFRLPRIERVVPTDDPYTIPPRFRLDRHFGGDGGGGPGRDRQAVWLRFDVDLADEVREAVGARASVMSEAADGRLDLRLTADGHDEVLGWVLRFDGRVEVVAPRELRRRLAESAARIANLHAEPAIEAGPVAV